MQNYKLYVLNSYNLNSIIEMLSLLSILFAGWLSGLVMGLIGIGGGTILMPLLMFVGLSLPQSVAIVLFTQVLPQTLPALIVYYNEGHFLLKESLIVIAGSFVGVTLGAFLAAKGYIPKKILYILMSCTLFVLSIGVWVRYC